MAVTPYTYALTTLTVVKEHLGIPISNVAFDDILQRFINASSQKIENWTDRLLMKRTGIVEYHSGIASNIIVLNQWPAEKPVELWIDSSSVFTDVTKKLDVTDYELELDSRGQGIGVMLLCSGPRLFPKGQRNIKIVYDAGYDTVPADLENACIWTVEYMYQMRDDRKVGISQKGKNQENVTFLENLPIFVQDAVNAYKRFDFASYQHHGMRTI